MRVDGASSASMATAMRWTSSVPRPPELTDAGEAAGAWFWAGRLVMDHALRHDADRDLSREDQPPGRRVDAGRSNPRYAPSATVETQPRCRLGRQHMGFDAFTELPNPRRMHPAWLIPPTGPEGPARIACVKPVIVSLEALRLQSVYFDEPRHAYRRSGDQAHPAGPVTAGPAERAAAMLQGKGIGLSARVCASLAF